MTLSRCVTGISFSRATSVGTASRESCLVYRASNFPVVTARSMFVLAIQASKFQKIRTVKAPSAIS
ncbi:MAG TPA: hypothetical protein VK491_01060, partial [Gemmatimonadaceae bacterium]|nr:hypothetical protein [Gemmatimonadaceae bacterium]